MSPSNVILSVHSLTSAILKPTEGKLPLVLNLILVNINLRFVSNGEHYSIFKGRHSHIK